MWRLLIGFLAVFTGGFPWRAATAQTPSTWTGDLASWVADSTGWTLNLSGAGSAWLATCPGPTALRRWEWRANFAPSTANFSRVYLFDVDSTAGHFLHLGAAGATDPVVLHAFATGTPAVPVGEAFPGFFAAGLASTWTATAEGLACAPLGWEPPAFPSDAFAWNAPAVPACIGIWATVTASNANGVRFSLLPDAVPAAPSRLLSAGLAAPDTLLLRFDTPVTPGGLLGADGPLPAPEEVPHPSGWPGPSGAFRVPLPDPVAAGGSADFVATGWEGAAETLVPDTGFTVWRALDGLPAGALAFTEIMADPTPATRWAELEWVEVYNPGPHALDLAQATWWDAGTGMAGLEPLFGWDGVLPPGERAVLSGGTVPVDPTGAVRPRQMRWTGGGTLLDAGDGIGLLGAEGWAAVVHYERSWWDGAGGGTSVSAACPRCCGSAENWGPQAASPGGPAPFEHGPEEVAPAVVEVVPISPRLWAVRCDRPLDPACAPRFVPPLGGTAECSADTLFLHWREARESEAVRFKVVGVRACRAPATRSDTLYGGGRVHRFPVAGDLAITEVHAAPAGRTEALPEFVEIMNLSEDTLECSGLRINKLPLTLRLLFPGERAALHAGPLANAAGTVVLEDAGGGLLERVVYSACAHRDRRNESSGRSLVRLDPFGPANDPRNWDSSTAELGASPGAVDPCERPWTDALAPQLLCTATSSAGSAVLLFDEPLAHTPPGWSTWLQPSGQEVWPGRAWHPTTAGQVADASGNTRWIAWKAPPAVPEEPPIWQLNEVLAEPGASAEPFIELRTTGAEGGVLNNQFFAATALPDPADWVNLSGSWEGLTLALPAGEWAFARCPSRLPTPRALPCDLPGLSGDRTVLLGTSTEVREAVDIGGQAHVPWLSTRTGISLERTRPEAGAAWVSAATGSTPGALNSQWSQADAYEAGALSCIPRTIRLHPSPPPNTAEIHWDAPVEGIWQTTCTALDPAGTVVEVLSGSATVAGGAVGKWSWDGRRDACCPVTPGVYWVRLEACAEAGGCRSWWTSLRVAP